MENSLKVVRMVSIILMVSGVLFFYIMTLMTIQIEDHEEYLEDAKKTNNKTVTIDAARGEIVDRYGRPLAQNRMGYSIVFDKNYLESGTENKIILELVKLLGEGETYVADNFPLVIDAAGRATFAEDSEKQVKKMKENLKLQAFATAQDCLDEMMLKWELGNVVTEEAKTVMTVRYGMIANQFSTSNPYTFAEDVSGETVQRIKENAMILKGVDVSVTPYREYLSGDLAPHLIGTVGAIFAEEYAELKSQGYRMDDRLGKSGIEKEMETYLRGTNGQRRITRDTDGNIVDIVDIQEAEAGNTVVLTIDSDLQRVAQESLKSCITNIAATSEVGKGADCNAGSAVVVDCRNGEVLAAASYPYYDLSEYNQKYNELLETDGNPLFNRALNGAYAPGSTFKPIMALAGLQEGVIEPESLIECNQYYIYDNFRLKCLGIHGNINVTMALTVSCNIFFYETGRRLGIDRMNDYCRQAGLGVLTGVGVGESKGTLASRELREKQNKSWYVADTLTSAIGQNDNRFTPVQMATYCMTIANGGKRYELNLVKTVKSAGLERTVIEDRADNPKLLNTINANNEIISTVKQGMLAVTREGTAAKVFGTYPISIGGKTGTAQGSGSDSGLFIAFAPYNNPQIAVVIIGEHAYHGSSMAPVAKDIFDFYFFGDRTTGDPVLTGTGLMP